MLLDQRERLQQQLMIFGMMGMEKRNHPPFFFILELPGFQWVNRGQKLNCHAGRL